MLGYFELPHDDQPEERIWHHAELMEEHWEAVKQRRANPSTPSEPMTEVPMTSNELAEEIKR